MKFSIITPTYNRAHYVLDTIKSIQQQTFTDWEHIIIDDGSRDTTSEIIHNAQALDSRIYYVQQDHKGAQAARNRGLKIATGDIIVYLDSDDKAASNFLEKIIETLADQDKIFGIPNHQRQKILLNDDDSVKTTLPPVIAHQNAIQLQDIYHWKVHTTSSGLFHRRNVIEYGIEWDTTIKRFQDWDLLMQLGNIFPDGFVCIPELLIKYYERYGGNSMSGTASYQDWADGFETMYQKHKHAALMTGQDWHPRLVEKYQQCQRDYEAGLIPPPHLRHFV